MSDWMQGGIITNPGIEAVAGKEVQELIGCDCKLMKSVVLFDTDKIDDFLTLCYRSQSSVRVLCLFVASEIKNMDDAVAQVRKSDFGDWLKDASFVVRSKIVDNEEIDTLESERLIGETIHEKYNAKVDLEHPIVPFYAYFIGNDFYFGVDFAGFDLGKRTYKIFATADSVKA
ncbi:MAG: THUMP domain-containing protein, partial [Candidatus Woesearchaeota archaeon]